MNSYQDFPETWQRFHEWLINITHLVVIGLVLWPLLFIESTILFPFQLSLLAALLIAVLSSNSLCVFLALQFSLFFREPRNLDVMEGITAIAYATISIALLMYVSRFRLLREKLVAKPKQQIRIGPRGHAIASAAGTNSMERMHMPSITSWVLRQLSRAIILAVLAQLVIVLPPFARNTYLNVQRSSVIESSIVYTTWFWIAILAIVIVAVEMAWRKLTSQQARLYVRAVVANHYFRDLRAITRLRRTRHKNRWIATKLRSERTQ